MGKGKGRSIRRQQRKKQQENKGEKLNEKKGVSNQTASNNKGYTKPKATTTYGNSCTHGKRIRPVLEFPAQGGASKHMLWAGGSWDVKEAIESGEVEPALVINLGGSSTLSTVRTSRKTKGASGTGVGLINGAADRLPSLSPEIESAREAEAEPIPILTIDWPDMGVPSFSRAWWEKLVADIRSMPGDVTINCMAGHGRTGTALAIIAYMSGACPKDKDPVEWIREVYCDRTVETNGQLDYIGKILGIKVKASPSKPSYGGVTSYGGYGGNTHYGGGKGKASTGNPSSGKSWEEDEFEKELLKALAEKNGDSSEFVYEEECLVCTVSPAKYYDDVDGYLCKDCCTHRAAWLVA